MGESMTIATYLLGIVIFVVGVFGIISIFRLHRDIDGPRLSDLPPREGGK